MEVVQEEENFGVASSFHELEWFPPPAEKKLFFGDGRDSALAER